MYAPHVGIPKRTDSRDRRATPAARGAEDSAAGAVVYSLQNEVSLTMPVPEGETSVAVALDGMHRQPDARYQVTVTPGWRAGEVWVTDKRADGFTVDSANPAPEGATLDVVVRRSPL